MGNPDDWFSWNAVEKVGKWGMNLGQTGMVPTRAVIASPLYSMLMLIAAYYPTSLCLISFLSEMVTKCCTWYSGCDADPEIWRAQHCCCVPLFCSCCVLTSWLSFLAQLCSELSSAFSCSYCHFNSFLRLTQLFRKSERYVNNVQFSPLQRYYLHSPTLNDLLWHCLFT